MSLSAAAIRLLGARGLTVEEIADVAEANAPEATLSPGAIRTRRWREAKAAASRCDVTETRHGDVTHVGEPARVVNPSLPSLRSEEVRIPPEKPSVSTPKGAEATRATRLPDDWRPDALGLVYAATELGPNVDPERELDRFRDYWRAVPGAKGRKLDWPGTWRNWCRNAADRLPRKPHERPHPDRRKDAFVERLGDIDAAMEAAFEQPRREH